MALNSLRNVEIDLFPYTRLVYLAPRTEPLNIWPVRRKALSRRVYGDGNPIHEWRWTALPITALDYIIDSYIRVASVDVTSAPVTIYTRRHDRLTYIRANAYLELPVPGQDYTYDRGRARDLVLRFHITGYP